MRAAPEASRRAWDLWELSPAPGAPGGSWAWREGGRCSSGGNSHELTRTRGGTRWWHGQLGAPQQPQESTPASGHWCSPVGRLLPSRASSPEHPPCSPSEKQHSERGRVHRSAERPGPPRPAAVSLQALCVGCVWSRCWAAVYLEHAQGAAGAGAPNGEPGGACPLLLLPWWLRLALLGPARGAGPPLPCISAFLCCVQRAPVPRTLWPSGGPS